MSKTLDLTMLFLDNRRNYVAFDECDDSTSGGRFTNTNTGTGAGVAFSAGNLTLTTGATANNLSARALTNPPIVMGTGLPAVMEARVKWTEASTNQANVFVGFSSALPADSLQNTGLGPLANFTGVGLFKVAGTTNWQAIASVGTTQTIVNLLSTATLNKQTAASGTGAYQVLKIEISNVTSTSAEAIFYIDTVEVYKIQWTWTSAAAMSAGCEIKAGTTASEVLFVDYMATQQERF
jgi:hypothetical protein